MPAGRIHPHFIDNLESALEFEACAVRLVCRLGSAHESRNFRSMMLRL